MMIGILVLVQNNLLQAVIELVILFIQQVIQKQIKCNKINIWMFTNLPQTLCVYGGKIPGRLNATERDDFRLKEPSAMSITLPLIHHPS